jgi:hypothetical protein
LADEAPLLATDPASNVTGPLIKLTASGFNGSATTAVWANEGRLGGSFVSELTKPIVTTKSGKQAVEFLVNQSNWMIGPRVSPWMNGSASRTVVAWVYNTTVSTAEDDVLFSWGRGSLGSTKPELFSCRYSTKPANGALAQGGTLASFDQGWGSYQPAQGSWSFVVYRYNGVDGTLLAMCDFQAGFLKRNSFLQTGIFNSLSRPHNFVLGGENKGDGTRDPSLKTGLCIGELQVFDRAVPLEEIIANIYNPSRVAYGKTTALVDTDLDSLPDLLETSLDLNQLVQDTDLDGVNDGLEFKAGNDAKDYYNGMPHYVTVTGGTNQWVWAGSETTIPITFKITDINGGPISSAPADASVITLPTPGGKLRLTPVGSSLGTALSTRTSTNGEISIIFKAN